MRWAGHVARKSEEKIVYKVLVEKPEGRRLPERPRHRWEDRLTMDSRKIGWRGCGVDSVDKDRDR
jgi:hypothetical protein